MPSDAPVPPEPAPLPPGVAASGGGAVEEQREWRRRRDDAALARAAVEERARVREAERARELLDAFLAEVRRRGIPPEPLRARAGAARYRTGLSGWYLRDDGSVGVSEAGDFYVLVTPASTRARLFGTVLHPTDPPLQVGRGGRDGESIDLARLLAQRLS